MPQTTRAQHLAWCKQRALEYIDRGETKDAFASMASDMEKHPETANHKAVEMGLMLLLGGLLDTPDQMRRFIEGFN